MRKKIKIDIMSIYGNVLFSYESVDNTLKKTMEKAVGWRANLRGANLRGADLRRADLREANLREANLWGANLREADLREANLREANLWGANLQEADLWRADLWGANLREANLREANLWGAENLQPIYFDNLYSLRLLPQKTKLTFWKYLEDGKSPYKFAEYKVGKTYKVKDFSTDENEGCDAGLNVATLMWCLRDSVNKENIELIEVEFKVSDIVAVPYYTDGKFRVKQFKVIRKISRKKGMDIMYKISGFKK